MLTQADFENKALQIADDIFPFDEPPSHGNITALAAQLYQILAAHSAGAQEPVAWLTPGNDLYLENPGYDDWTPLYSHPQPMPQTDAARDAEDANRYRFIKSQMKVGAVQTQLPLYRTLHWIGYEDCSDVRNADAAIDAEIERIDRAKGE